MRLLPLALGLAALGLAALVLAVPAGAQEHPVTVLPGQPRVLLAVTLELRLGKGVRCDAEGYVHREISFREGYDPFVPNRGAYPSGTVRVVVRRAGGGLVATYTYTGADDDPPSSYTVESPDATEWDCQRILSVVVARMAVELVGREDSLGRRFAPPPPRPPEREPVVECPPASPAPDDTLEPLPPPLEVPRPTRTPAEKPPLSFRLGSGVWVDRISDDRGSVGLTLDASVRYRWGSVGVELRGDPPLGTTVVSSERSVRFARVTGALLLCGHVDPLVGCLKGQVGAMLFPGSVPSEPAQLYATAGVRLGLEFPIAPSRFILRVDGELLPTIDPASIGPGKGTVFQVAGLNAGLGLGASFSLGKR